MESNTDQDDGQEDIGRNSQKMGNESSASDIVIPGHDLAEECIKHAEEHDQSKGPKIRAQCRKVIKLRRDPTAAKQQQRSEQKVAHDQ